MKKFMIKDYIKEHDITLTEEVYSSLTKKLKYDSLSADVNID